MGTRLAYTAEHLSLAMIEYFVYIGSDDAPRDLVVVTVEIPDGVSRARFSTRRLPADWRENPAPAALARFGDQFVLKRHHAVLIVPSALSPAESDWLIDPAHPDFAKIRVASKDEFQYDERFFK